MQATAAQEDLHPCRASSADNTKEAHRRLFPSARISVDLVMGFSHKRTIPLYRSRFLSLQVLQAALRRSTIRRLRGFTLVCFMDHRLIRIWEAWMEVKLERQEE